MVIPHVDQAQVAERRLPVEVDDLLVGSPSPRLQVDLPGYVGVEVGPDRQRPVQRMGAADDASERSGELLLRRFLRGEGPYFGTPALPIAATGRVIAKKPARRMPLGLELRAFPAEGAVRGRITTETSLVDRTSHELAPSSCPASSSATPSSSLDAPNSSASYVPSSRRSRAVTKGAFPSAARARTSWIRRSFSGCPSGDHSSRRDLSKYACSLVRYSRSKLRRSLIRRSSSSRSRTRDITACRWRCCASGSRVSARA